MCFLFLKFTVFFPLTFQSGPERPAPEHEKSSTETPQWRSVFLYNVSVVR